MSFSLFRWPDGLAWKIIMPFMIASRRRRFALFMKLLKPDKKATILDVGAGGGLEASLNFLEHWYPHPEMITALAVEELPQFRRAHPKITLVVGDGRDLPFKDNAFDIYFSNAVIEHVGSFSNQKKFIREACRVAPRVFISTPYRWFPIDFHTLIPFAHYLPMAARNSLYRLFGRTYYATEQNLRLLDKTDIKKMLPTNVRLIWKPQRVLGLVSNINIVLERI